MPKIGDRVRFLNSVGGGTIVRIVDNIAHVADEDGFETPVLMRELVVVENASEKPKTSADKTVVEAFRAPSSSPRSATVEAPQPQLSDADIEETPDGDRLNIVLAFEPEDRKQLSETTISAYLVNDSNYYLYFAYLTRPDEKAGWTTRYAGIVEPNIQLYLGDVDRAEINQMGRIAVEYIAFKRNREFKHKKPAFVEHNFDPTKFFKLHCFRENEYFDNPVLAIDIVRNDVLSLQPKIDARQVENEMKQKIRADRRPVVKRKVAQTNSQPDGTLVVDLHITELVDTIRGLSNADMLNLQVDEFRRVMDENIKNHGKKIVFIHGKGEGVLRQAIMKELNYRYKNHSVQDASFREYGYGATQVTIK